MAEFDPSQHHGTPPPEFVGLCDLAERIGMTVGLDVSDTAFGGDDTPYRNVISVRVYSDDPLFTDRLGVTILFAPGDTLPKMAERARRELEAKL